MLKADDTVLLARRRRLKHNAAIAIVHDTFVFHGYSVSAFSSLLRVILNWMVRW